jgi:pilus assembly protein Flp/PilA
LQFIMFALLTLKARVADHKDKERGATAVEYGLLVALIAAVIVAVVAILGGQIDTAFCTIVTELGGTC